MTLSEISADPRAKEGREFTAPGKAGLLYKFDHELLLRNHPDSFHWHVPTIHIEDLTRTDWHFIEPAGVES